MEEEYREAGYIETTPFEWPPVAPPIGEVAPWLQKYGPLLLGGTALVFSIIALSRK